jgi:hypothetical protein
MKSIIGILAAFGAGAALMYLFDPNGGNRRRALIRDKAVGLSHDVRETVNSRTRDLSNRAKGLVHNAKALIPSTGDGQAEQAEQRLA